ncbi:putative monovalent cation/H+ antiporter subunit E [Halalkalicoccus jeotgali B3]|uniref:Monovalent cation/H+ antiporter subunit E n=1 Tax=Halalkalicoccus jeotgali (strain DSM 18796 / CECT 7217 / JCM 14584 / KCTC 4019 / B3) TaxID=795797 RepID=D8J653_HALJB|nr:putative monovalent cation/H+ antiporter subunit E [Halalkalicoccus jeotgali B3]
MPVERSVTLRRTVGYATESARAAEGSVEIHFVAAVTDDERTPGGRESVEAAQSLLDRVRAWADEDLGEGSVTVETAVVGADRYLFGPRDYADCLAEYARENDIDRVLIDPEYRPGASAPMLRPIEHRLAERGIEFKEAPVEPKTRRGRLVTAGGASRFFTLFAVAFGFYLVLGDPTYWFDLATGAVAGLIVAVTLDHVTFSSPPSIRRTPVRVARFLVYVPYLLFEIVKANVAVSLVILRPSMPIQPQMTRVRSAVRDGLPLTTLANSITLTPGTLTVRANDRNLLVHTLITDAREDLFDGGLERAVRFVFYGRNAAGIASPEERGDTEILGGEES